MSYKKQGFYPQPLCFKNRDNVIIDKNIFMEEYNFPAIAITYCKNTTENGNWCKSKDEIDNFLAYTPNYFVHMVTHVDYGIFYDDPAVD